MSSPAISVALPVYNGANYLREALESVLSQRFADFELVVSDNASTDDTPAILAEYARRDHRMHVSRTAKTIPQACNVNRAVRQCAGDWVKLFCHDDLMSPDCLETLLGAIGSDAGGSVGLIGNGEVWLFANGHRQATTHGPHTENRLLAGSDIVRSVVAGHNPIPLPSLSTATVRKSAWQQFGGFDPRFAHFDVFYWLALLTSWDYLWVPRPLTVNRIHSAQVAVSARTSLRSVADHRLFWPEFIDAYGSTFGIGRRGRTVARMRPLGAAASIIAIELLKRKPVSAGRVALRTPMKWWPLLPLLIARSSQREYQKVRSLRGSVPIALIYP